MPDRSPQDQPQYRALIQLLRTAEDLWNASRQFFVRWRLSPSQFNVLNVLHQQPRGRSQSELSRLLIMHRSNATGLVDRLERRGLVRRIDDPADRRIYRVVLTDAGVRLLEEIYPHYHAAAEQVWAGLPVERVDQILEELQKLAGQAGRMAANLPPSPASGVGTEEKVLPKAESRRKVAHGKRVRTGEPAVPESLRISDL